MYKATELNRPRPKISKMNEEEVQKHHQSEDFAAISHQGNAVVVTVGTQHNRSALSKIAKRVLAVASANTLGMLTSDCGQKQLDSDSDEATNATNVVVDITTKKKNHGAYRRGWYFVESLLRWDHSKASDAVAANGIRSGFYCSKDCSTKCTSCSLAVIDKPEQNHSTGREQDISCVGANTPPEAFVYSYLAPSAQDTSSSPSTTSTPQTVIKTTSLPSSPFATYTPQLVRPLPHFLESLFGVISPQDRDRSDSSPQLSCPDFFSSTSHTTPLTPDIEICSSEPPLKEPESHVQTPSPSPAPARAVTISRVKGNRTRAARNGVRVLSARMPATAVAIVRAQAVEISIGQVHGKASRGNGISPPPAHVERARTYYQAPTKQRKTREKHDAVRGFPPHSLAPTPPAFVPSSPSAVFFPASIATVSDTPSQTPLLPPIPTDILPTIAHAAVHGDLPSAALLRSLLREITLAERDPHRCRWPAPSRRLVHRAHLVLVLDMCMAAGGLAYTTFDTVRRQLFPRAEEERMEGVVFNSYVHHAVRAGEVGETMGVQILLHATDGGELWDEDRVGDEVDVWLYEDMVTREELEAAAQTLSELEERVGEYVRGVEDYLRGDARRDSLDPVS
ncbi:hypothetical protein ACN47E_002538 [Coniothyrium glycines]